MSNTLVLLVGGPGAGKTTTLRILEQKGFPCMTDSARRTISQRIAQGMPPRPHPEEFARQILAADIAQYEAAERMSGLIFFERGVCDALGMLYDCGALSPEALLEARDRYRYHNSVFLFPPWKDIYVTDAERDQGWEEANRIGASIENSYVHLGYEVKYVPRGTPEERAELILEILGAN